MLCIKKVKPFTNRMPLPAREGRIVVFLYQELQAMVIGRHNMLNPKSQNDHDNKDETNKNVSPKQ